ncbi:unnamed protein product [Aphanomyces euteiches]|uniref:Uncharacterized protein n=1 Tax=Aphanomyces euteiches TaxID=100861 RepID=A0A6G0XRH5_9STRA|nr:hypothetical protein Ae201684_002208 [Aphanomyces euteiches]KAH9087537.1 hypothetical protein Ae201684P_000939 [Aphanomyces euteiches]KAH9109054.1 hypothetical protein AeMF1_015852 [Aphanomyces euteiches]KAH9133776.1 hypothetical protein LEN26_007004 [Aphanomyces euteiches]KAH9139836.1 hypothetical protein AeRB84_015904 [Aphanomyces euteiches]
MSSQRGNVKKGAPKYQNSFAYKHNPKSKKTEHILGLPIHGLCPHCHAQIVWRKKYRKYKPLTQPASCTSCHQKTVLAAYHVLCQPCAKEKGVCAKCCKSEELVLSEQQVAEMKEEENKEFEDQLDGLKERERRKVLRQKKKEEEEAAAAAKAARRAALGLDTYDDDDDLDDMEQYLSD